MGSKGVFSVFIVLFSILGYFAHGQRIDNQDQMIPDTDAAAERRIVNANIYPQLYIQANGPVSFCPGGSVQLTAVGQFWAGCHYEWSNGMTTQTITVTTPGTYNVIVHCAKCGTSYNYTTNPVTVTTSFLPTDLNSDGVVDVPDYMIFLSNYIAPCAGCPQDFNHDGIVNTVDYLIWVGDIFKTCQ